MKQRHYLAFLALFNVLLAISNASAADVQPFRASYAISNGEYTVGTATLSLESSGDQWSMQLATEPSGVFKLMSRGYTTETSTLVVDSTTEQPRFLPVRYSYQQKNGKPERNLSAEFLPVGKAVSVLTQAGKETVIQTEAPVHDPLSSMLETMRVLRDGGSGEIVLDVFSRGEIKQHQLAIGERELIKSDAGEHSAIRVTRKHSGSARETRVWYAKSLNYAPVRIEQHKRGKLVARLSLTTIDQ